MNNSLKPMTEALVLDLKKLESRAYHAAEWAEDTLRCYHATIPKLQEEAAARLRVLYGWMFVPLTFWPFTHRP
ncbi:MAG: hypothetical protein K9N47_27675 [Prosthecobacter sp.]|uniref:hypothetical protein n=1 Tax=Prosthecobacter sp. TaxID=1965333 RepID=UPI0026200E65|nr:hypothetical protein [Prosthecobacter sp.]MCF7789934.1 hypothetical protein [Prosthecobacter sp.]